MQVNLVRPLGSGVRAFARCAARLVDEAHAHVGPDQTVSVHGAKPDRRRLIVEFVARLVILRLRNEVVVADLALLHADSTHELTETDAGHGRTPYIDPSSGGAARIDLAHLGGRFERPMGHAGTGSA